MSLFERFRRAQPGPPSLQPATEPPAAPRSGHEVEPPPQREADAPRPERIHVARTLVKSEPELAELVASDPRLSRDGCEVRLAEKGFGTRVAISAPADRGTGVEELEALLDELAEPQKRPFTNS